MKHEHHKHHDHHKSMMRDFKRRFVVSTILTIPILILSPFIQELLGFELAFTWSQYLRFLLATAIYVYGGKPFISGMIKELKNRKPGMMTLIGLAISVAYFYSSAVILIIPGKSFYWELATLIDIMLLGHYIEMKATMAASRALEKLAKLIPKQAHLITKEGKIIDTPTSKLKVGDRVLVKPGERIPSDGVVIEGKTTVDESMLTGESVPVLKVPGSQVIGGSINIDGSIIVEITKVGEETYLSQIIKIVKAAQETKSRTQLLADRVALYLTIIAIVVGTITFAIWYAYLGDPLFALERMVTVMVITCPHALGLAIPLAIAVSASKAASRGFIIKDREAFETARKTTVVVFDKTGTLTTGKFSVADIIPLSDMSQEEIIKIAYSLERLSEHPIAKGIADRAKELGIDPLPVEEFRSDPGRGVEGLIGGEKYLVVGSNYIKENKIDVKDEKIGSLSQKGMTIVYVLKSDKPIGAIGLVDTIRPESREAIANLKKMNIKCIMITGDNKLVADWVAKELELDEYYAEVLPHEKARIIENIKQRGEIVAMVGDGINDAPALVSADVGIAIGSGTDIAIESADVILVRNDPRDVVHVIRLSKATYRKMKENIAWATGYNALAIPVAAGILSPWGILLSPAIGALLMSISTVIVAFNSKRLSI